MIFTFQFLLQLPSAVDPLRRTTRFTPHLPVPNATELSTVRRHTQAGFVRQVHAQRGNHLKLRNRPHKSGISEMWAFPKNALGHEVSRISLRPFPTARPRAAEIQVRAFVLDDTTH
jgi:hypothetical protein